MKLFPSKKILGQKKVCERKRANLFSDASIWSRESFLIEDKNG